MLSEEEVAGVLEVLAAAGSDELFCIAIEIAGMRDEPVPERRAFESLLKKAVKDRIIEPVSAQEVKGCSSEKIYIPGPAAFPSVPDELSAVMDILRIKKRKIDWKKVAPSRVNELSGEVDEFTSSIEGLAGGWLNKKKVSQLEKEYGRLMSTCSDFEFWIPADVYGLKTVRAKLQRIKEELSRAGGLISGFTCQA
ncbi:MAG TPA: hypothetical protein HA257_09820 [Candidatus Methanoperedenaceae archaeon]|nr:hypothetical protein [Candidatus Methanoperedenaceae archaeon]